MDRAEDNDCSKNLSTSETAVVEAFSNNFTAALSRLTRLKTVDLANDFDSSLEEPGDYLKRVCTTRHSDLQSSRSVSDYFTPAPKNHWLTHITRKRDTKKNGVNVRLRDGNFTSPKIVKAVMIKGILGKSTNKREEAKFSTTSPVKEYSRRNPSLNIFLDRCAQGIPRVNKKLEWSPYSSVYKGKARVSPRLYVKIIGEHTIN
eukprot:TRINITY_DN10551_c0_g2_i2.p1 TRINITY_DN10551_c0_g2~~TRINITY_DN10551_c0_g2_i2.p1  ORF type:complete len:203 (+),score=23.94 TRINITY_DN10551_c0_g2_i2:101-709(+)